MTLFLKIVSGQGAGSEIPLEGDLLIGRSATDGGSLGGDTEISRKHARITRGAAGEAMIEDLGSTNGTYVDGHPIIGRTEIRGGTRISLGASELEVVERSPQSAETRLKDRPPAAEPPTAARPAPRGEQVTRAPGQMLSGTQGLSGVMMRLSKQPGALPDQGADFIEDDDPPGRHPTIIAIATIIAGLLMGGMIAAAIFADDSTAATARVLVGLAGLT